MPTTSAKIKRLRGIEQGMPDGVVIDRTTGEYLLTKQQYPPETVAFVLDYSVSKIYELVHDERLDAACLNGHKRKPLKITRTSILRLQAAILVPGEKWAE